jgi:peptidoglycan/xylan/chitin deacetylase (PgdA/CDA1 family)
MSDPASRFVSLVSDPRLPLYYPLNRSHWGRRFEAAEPGRELDVLFTFDLECDYGSGGPGNTKYPLPFLKKAGPFFKEHGIRATLFAQGNLIAKCADGLRALGPDHEIGLHGYAHEPWGASWFIDEPLPNVAARRQLIANSLRAFHDAGFERPVSFRAPNMVADAASLKLLKEGGFAADSSFPSYAGGLPTLSSPEGLVEVPVSFDPRPMFGRFLMARYLVFNTHNLANQEFKDGFANAALRVAKAQASAGQKPFIVFLSHPWEFFQPDPGFDNEFFGYSSEKNFAVLADAIADLKKAFKLRFRTVSELASSRK